MLEKWSLRYWALKQYVNFANRLFHRELIVHGKENIPVDKPVIFASNHPNALSDILCIVYAVPQQTVWLARASLFNARWARSFLKFLKIIPVYRLRDGKDSLGGNDQSFAAALQILQNNGALGIYPEGANSENRKMLPHKKAVARIVSMAGELTGDSSDLQIVPVGLHYDHFHRFGRRCLISFGKPLQAKEYYPLFRKNGHEATRKLRDDLFNAILPMVLNYQTSQFFSGFEAIREIAAKPLAIQWGFPDNLEGQLKGEQQLAATLDSLAISKPETAESLAETGYTLLSDLKKRKLRSWLVDLQEERFTKTIRATLLLIITLPVFIYGAAFNIIPFAVLGKTIRKKVADPKWISTFTFGLGLVVFPLFYIILLLVLSPLLPTWYLKVIFFISLPFSGKISFRWYISLLKTRGRWRWLITKKKNPEVYNDFHLRKEKLLKAVVNQG